MKLLRAALMLAALLAAIPATAADSGSTTGHLMVQGVEANGKVELQAPLLSFARFDLAAETLISEATDEVTAFDWQLQARAVRAVTHEVNVTIRGPRGDSSPLPYSYEMDFADAVVSSLGARSRYRLDVAPLDANLPMVHVSSDCAGLEPSDDSSVEVQSKVDSAAPRFTTDVSNAVGWTECGHSSVTIRGSFVLVLWNNNAEVQSNGETAELRSGLDRTEAAPEPAASLLYPAVSKARQQYLYADDAVLTIPSMDNTTHWAFVDTPRLETEGTVQFTNATGELGQHGAIQPIDAASLGVAGGLDVQNIHSTGRGGRLQVNLGGRLDAASVDGRPLSFAVSPSPDGQGLSPWLFGLIGAVLVPSVALPLRRRALRRRRQAELAERAQNLLNLNRGTEAEPLVDELVQMAPRDPRVRHQQALLLECRGDLRAAVELRRSLDRALQAEPGGSRTFLAENRFKIALLGGQLRRQVVGLERAEWHRTSLRYLREAVSTNPDLVEYVPLHPELAALHSELRGTSIDGFFRN